MLIIAVFVLGLSGCGYKAPPYYLEDAPQSDENVEFKLKKVNVDNDKSTNTECVKEN